MIDAPVETRHDEAIRGTTDERVKRALESAGIYLSKGELAERTGINPRTVPDVLARLRAAGEVAHVGNGRGTKYGLATWDGGATPPPDLLPESSDDELAAEEARAPAPPEPEPPSPPALEGPEDDALLRLYVEASERYLWILLDSLEQDYNALVADRIEKMLAGLV